MKIIICDDERMDAERAKTILLSCKCVQEEDITILTPQEMHLGLEVQDIKCDIAIMDIEYENRQFNGITLSKELNKKAAAVPDHLSDMGIGICTGSV